MRAWLKRLDKGVLENCKNEIKDLTKAIEVADDDAASYFGQGCVYKKLEQYKNAAKYSDKTIKLIENGVEIDFEKHLPYLALSETYAKLSQPEKEEEYLKKAKEMGYRE